MARWDRTRLTTARAWARGFCAVVILIAASLLAPAHGWAQKTVQTGAQYFSKDGPPAKVDAGPCPTPDELARLQLLRAEWQADWQAAIAAYDRKTQADAAFQSARVALARATAAWQQALAADKAAHTPPNEAAVKAADTARATAHTAYAVAGVGAWAAGAALEDAKDDLRWSIFDYRQLAATLQKKKCPQPTTTPPPNGSPPSGGPAPPKLPRAVTPTHRTTFCAKCQPLADELNKAADNYADAVRRNDPDQAHFRSEMSRLAGELDFCERACHLQMPDSKLLLPTPPSNPGGPRVDPEDCGGSLEFGVVDEINKARSDPKAYAGRLRAGPLSQGVGDAVAFLERQPPIAPLSCDGRLATAAAAHAADQGPLGQISHTGSDGSRALQRMQKAGVFSSVYAEEISMGQTSAAGVVTQLILDIPGPAHPHRADLFDPMLKEAGVGCGPNKTYRSMCVIDLSSGAVAP
jgi:uncharacterized protein YkwD